MSPDARAPSQPSRADSPRDPRPAANPQRCGAHLFRPARHGAMAAAFGVAGFLFKRFIRVSHSMQRASSCAHAITVDTDRDRGFAWSN